MTPEHDILEARRVLTHEGKAIIRCGHELGDSFTQAVEAILSCSGRVVACGVGKSGHIARKTAGTFSSTGTPSLFLHAAEAVHGDLGMVTASDIVLMFTHSGETDELVKLFPSLREIGARTILITGRAGSTCARAADLVLDTRVTDEACSNNLAPTTSTTVMLALADALAVTVMGRRNFTSEDFARYHPSGTLGKRLLLRVSDVMRAPADMAILPSSAPVIEVIRAMTEAAVGAAVVVNDDTLVGIVSEGNLRKHLLGRGNLEGTAADMMNANPLTIDADLLAIDALEVFQNFPVKIGEIPVVQGGKVVGLLILKELLRSGIV